MRVIRISQHDEDETGKELNICKSIQLQNGSSQCDGLEVLVELPIAFQVQVDVVPHLIVQVVGHSGVDESKRDDAE